MKLDNDKKFFIFFGIVGSGKGTQIELLKQYIESKYGEYVFVSYPGQAFRTLIQEDSYTSSLVKAGLASGKLQPDFLATSMFTETFLHKIRKDDYFISDGYPRTIRQAMAFDEIRRFYGIKNVEIINIRLSKDEAIRRMELRARADDNQEGIKNRLEEHMNHVVPTVDYLRDKDGYTMHHIDGEQSIEKVHEDIINSLGI